MHWNSPPSINTFSSTLCIEIELVAKQRGEFTQPGGRVYPAMHTHKTAVEYMDSHAHTHKPTIQIPSNINRGCFYFSEHQPIKAHRDRQTDGRTEANPNHSGSTKTAAQNSYWSTKIIHLLLIYVHTYTNNTAVY